MTKPFEIEELIARVGVQMKRAAGSRPAQSLSYKGLTINTEELSVVLNGQPLSFTKLEYKILELFLQYPGRVFTKQDVYDYAWEDIYVGEDKTVNMHISNIRRKLKAVSEEEYIETVWGIGFKLSK